jgi:hypothetical protein
MKAQIALEYIVYVSVVIFLLAVASYAAATSSAGINADNEVDDARRIAAVVAQEINLAVEIGDGYNHEFFLPAAIYGGKDYTVTFTEAKFVYVNWDGKHFSLPVLTANLQGNVNKGGVKIRNSEGAIVFG